MQALFELLEIKSDVWKSTKERQQAEERNRSCDRLKAKSLKTDINSNESSKTQDVPSGSSLSESDTPSAGYSKDQDRSESEALSIKKENMSGSSHDERDDEEQDGDKECCRLTNRRRSSSNPVNLSLARNTENTSSEHDDSQDVDVENVGAKVCIILKTYFRILLCCKPHFVCFLM